jgi:hypothetical protein
MLCLIGVNAIIAGYGFIGTPDGSAVGIPKEWLSDTRFRDFLIPGFLLFGLGVLHLLTAYSQLRNGVIATLLAEVSGLGLLIWIAVQAALMGSFRHPAQTILQASCLLIALLTLFFASKQERQQASDSGALKRLTRTYP